MFHSLLFSTICKASSDNHFAFLHFFSLWMVLITASYTMSQTSVHSSSGTLSDLIPWIYLSLPLYNCKGFYFSHTWNGPVVFPTFFNLSLNFAIRNSWSEPQSAPGLVFADCIELLEEEIATHSNILAWRIPWTEEPGGLQSTGSQRVWTMVLEKTLESPLGSKEIKPVKPKGNQP